MQSWFKYHSFLINNKQLACAIRNAEFRFCLIDLCLNNIFICNTKYDQQLILKFRWNQIINNLEQMTDNNTFQAIQMADSIKFNDEKSRASSRTSSPQKKSSCNYKCFKCAGRSSNVKFCQICKGKGAIPQSHPMCHLLNDIVNAKLSANLFNQSLSLKQITPISEESSVLQEKIMLCDKCNKQCDPNDYFMCTQCTLFYLCNDCQGKKSYTHQHQLIKNKSEQEQEYQSSFCQMECRNCSKPFEQFYMICDDCDKIGKAFMICDLCYDKQTFSHHHKTFKPKYNMISQSPVFMGNISGFSQASFQNQSNNFQKFDFSPQKSYLEQNYEVYHIKLGLEQQRLSETPDQQYLGNILQKEQRFSDWRNSQGRPSRGSNNVDSTKSIIKTKVLGMNIESVEEYQIGKPAKLQQIHQKLSQQQSRASVISGSVRIKHLEQSQVNLQISMLDSMEYGKPQIRKTTSRINSESQDATSSQEIDSGEDQIRKGAIKSQSQQSSASEQNPDDYLFNDFQCDICQVSPIRKVRYHCKECENFDICKRCFRKNQGKHKHRNYEIIDGKELKKQKMQKMKIILNKYNPKPRSSIR